ncbi:MAG TPA: hypothetical protein VNK04_20650 [Gemmataceae bacterium]|nr:hypothetical protein [Gemmataceae bacterium]
MSQPICRFRLQFLGPAIRFSILTAILFEGLIRLDGVLLDHGAWLVARLFLLLGAALWMGLLVLLCRVRVTPLGIKSPDWPWIVRELPWDSIAIVQRVNLLGFRFLVLYAANKPFGMWVPLFLKDGDQFWRMVKGCVPLDHPLRIAAEPDAAPAPARDVGSEAS